MMKKQKRFILLVLLFVMQLQVVHAFVIESLDAHSCSVREYVTQIQHPLHVDAAGSDVCDIYHFFHTPFVALSPLILPLNPDLSSPLFPDINLYVHSRNDTFLKPPII